MSETVLSSQPPRVRPQPVLKVGKSERTRAAILDAALAFLWSNPFRDMSVNALMATTSVSRSAFYQYFHDVHELMEAMLADLGEEILKFITPWLEGEGDVITLLEESVSEFVRICHKQGPFLQAISDAAPSHGRLEIVWTEFLDHFDDVIAARIEADQELGLTPVFAPRPIAVALNRTNAYTVIQAFGKHPRGEPGPVSDALKRIWVATLYGGDQTTTDRRVRRDG
ncbi:MAG: TetR/AcrR family transcriptional regulator [Gammaproteobacteria bacterium]|jgi:AcrR family transcriptional regulator|nr:TetR/AcrR family transcriptional regulator [Gammaproteobacteria bacterium]